jgi:hypothetical protein
MTIHYEVQRQGNTRFWHATGCVELQVGETTCAVFLKGREISSRAKKRRGKASSAMPRNGLTPCSNVALDRRKYFQASQILVIAFQHQLAGAVGRLRQLCLRKACV